jgi:futalosine hydrolase
MLLVVSATEKEIKPILDLLIKSSQVELLITGMGPVATGVSLGSYLAVHGAEIEGVLNIGVGGAYIDSGLNILDICLARQDVLGDFGICKENEILDFDQELTGLNKPFFFDNDLSVYCRSSMEAGGIAFKEANFVTVNCCSGSDKRGAYLREKFDGDCENMEGAVVAMVCHEYNIPFAEIRCISNMVKDRDVSAWKMKEAISTICEVTESVLKGKYI